VPTNCQPTAMAVRVSDVTGATTRKGGTMAAPLTPARNSSDTSRPRRTHPVRKRRVRLGQRGVAPRARHADKWPLLAAGSCNYTHELVLASGSGLHHRCPTTARQGHSARAGEGVRGPPSLPGERLGRTRVSAAHRVFSRLYIGPIGPRVLPLAG
jgi:hypothetical protein